MSAHIVKMLRQIADDLENGSAVFLDGGPEAECLQLTPLPGEEWAMSSNTGRITFAIRYAMRSTEKRHAALMLDRARR